MVINRCLVITVCFSVSFLFGQTLIGFVSAFSPINSSSRFRQRHQYHHDPRSSLCLQAAGQQPLTSASEPGTDGRRSGARGSPVRGMGARAIAAQARQRARDAARQSRSRMRGTEQGAISTLEQLVNGPTRRPRISEPRLPETKEDVTVEGDEAKEQRVREILDEYFITAPPVEQWPPGRNIRVRGVDIFYKDTGKRRVKGNVDKDRPTFVLLHGLSGSTASWDEVVGDLAEYGRVISFDRPGFGKTERVMPPNGLPWRFCPQTLGENPYSASFASKVLFGILDRLGVDKVILVAHSLGAQVALRAARARPSMVRAMVLVAPAVLNPLDSKFVMGRDPNASLFSPIVNLRTRVEMTAKLAAFNLQLLQPGQAPLETVRNITLNGDVEAKVQHNFHDPSIPAARPELISKYLEPLTDPLWDRGLLHFYKSLQREVQPGEQLLQSTLEVWKGPSMIITGDDDPTIPTQSSVFVAEEMEGRLVVMESCAHIPMDEKSEVFTSSVLSFTNSEEVRNAWHADGTSAKSWW